MKVHEVRTDKEQEHFIKLYQCLALELFGEEHVPETSELSERLTNSLEEKSRHWSFLLYEDEASEPFGFFTLGESFAFFAKGFYGIINELWLKPEQRSKGVGASILSYIQDFAREKCWKRIDVSAPADDKWLRSFQFYLKNDFVFTGKKCKFLL